LNEADNISKIKYNRSGPTGKAAKLALLILIAAIITGAIITWAGIGAGARNTMSTAKDIRTAMKLISTEYYGENRSLYDPSTVTGLSDSALEKIRGVCPFKGELTLYSWDDENSIPIYFTYREDRYLVEYKDTGTGNGAYGMNGDWTVYYSVRVLEYKAQN